jgi:uncharacterized membrane protein YeaQ/YmgE (transglycosylase-associated protein family)
LPRKETLYYDQLHNDFSLNGLLVAFIGAVVLLGIVNLVRRGSVR